MSNGQTRLHKSSTLLSDWSVSVICSEKKVGNTKSIFFYYIPRLVVLLFFFISFLLEKVKELIQNKSVSLGKEKKEFRYDDHE